MTEDTYTHRPGAVEESEAQRASKAQSEAQRASKDRGGREDDGTAAAADPEVADPAAPVERGEEEWNGRDWMLVGVIALCFLVIPAAILVLPPVRPFRFAYLVLPLIPAFLLGATAVWSAQRSG